MIGVCIKYFHENYGGMLQAYATISWLDARGLDYELIQYEKKWSLFNIVKSLPRLLNGVLLNDKYEAFLKKIGKKKHPEFARNDEIRKESFRKFKESHFVRLSPVFKGYDELCKGARRYSAVITGSDQLWSPAGLPTNYYNLMFVPDDILKISIASSFGVKEIPWYQKRRTEKFLNRIESISMRENRGCDIVKELTGRTVPTILDPVFFLSCEEWLERIPNEWEIEEPYIFVYFLGTNWEYRKEVQEIAKKKELKIVSLRHMDQYVSEDEKFGDFTPYDVGPERFLNLLRNAKYVCTDSFHGAAFSIINQKQFVVFDRYDEKSSFSKNARIDTLCQNFDLENRRYKKNKKMSEILMHDIDYEKVWEKYKYLKEITDEYMNGLLKAIENEIKTK